MVKQTFRKLEGMKSNESKTDARCDSRILFCKPRVSFILSRRKIFARNGMFAKRRAGTLVVLHTVEHD